MTKDEAGEIILQFQAGKEFVTRFQEEEWGIYFQNNTYIYWTYSLDSGGRESRLRREMSEEETVKLLMNISSYNTILSGLR